MYTANMSRRIQIRIEPVDANWGKDTEFEQLESLITRNNRSFTDQELKKLLGSGVMSAMTPTYVSNDKEADSD